MFVVHHVEVELVDRIMGGRPVQTHVVPTCGEIGILSRENTTKEPGHVTCINCGLRLVAFFQNEQSKLLRNISVTYAALEKARTAFPLPDVLK